MLLTAIALITAAQVAASACGAVGAALAAGLLARRGLEPDSLSTAETERFMLHTIFDTDPTCEMQIPLAALIV
ncbi:MAG: hypothetical protein ACI8PZ_002709 [Myxococcota bacterium]|jgi:hypothetical protein